MPEVSTNIFEKCLPAFTADIKACGTITTCNISPATKATLESFFHDGTNYKVFGALIHFEFELGSCDVEQNGLYDLIMATRKDWSQRRNLTNMDGGLYEIKPFVMGRRKSILNNEYWTVSNGQSSGGNWQVDVTSQTGIPLDVRWFLTPEVVFIFGKTAGGTATETAWKISSATLVGAVIRLVLVSQNTNSTMPAARLASPVTGYMTRGVGNINGYESFCLEGPGLNLEQRVPFWVQSTRWATCDDELFRKYQEALVKDNPYFATFKNVDAVEKNKQLGDDFKRKMVNYFFYGKALANQDLTNYGSLETISSATPSALVIPGSGRCVGKRANAVGVIEQLWECGRAADLQGQVLNLPEFFADILYDISRVRSPSDDGRILIESMTDSYFASLIQLAMVNYYVYQTAGKLQVTQPMMAKQAVLGFWYREYELIYPVVTWRVLTHRYFDDRVTAARNVAAANEATGRQLWTLDWSDLFMAILGSREKTNVTGDINTLSGIDSNLACVMDYPKNTYKLMETEFTNVVQCPRRHYVLGNIAATVPEHRAPSIFGAHDYYGVYSG